MYLEQEHRELDQVWRQRLERAALETERASRHYQLIEPENRLVARVLAAEWEAKLLAQQQLQEDYARFAVLQLSGTELEIVLHLAR